MLLNHRFQLEEHLESSLWPNRQTFWDNVSEMILLENEHCIRKKVVNMAKCFCDRAQSKELPI
jgi:hypothetical protein